MLKLSVFQSKLYGSVLCRCMTCFFSSISGLKPVFDPFELIFRKTLFSLVDHRYQQVSISRLYGTFKVTEHSYGLFEYLYFNTALLLSASS